MAKIKVNQDRVTKDIAKQLEELCPFGAISEENGILSISSGCRMCRICVKKGPAGVVEWIDEDLGDCAVERKMEGDCCIYSDGWR